jgi:hypothetical protein
MDGWIKLHRKSYLNHLYTENRPHTKREAWEDILIHVNYEDSFFLVGNGKIECKRGQSLMSLDSWARIFNWSKSSVKRFFDLLKKEKMIDVENMLKTTRLTVCNYEDYQGDRNAKETQKKRKRTTIKESKEDIDKSISLWREDFSVYLSQCKAGYKAFNENTPLMETQKRLNPGINVKLSIEKGFMNYWGTEAGWKKKKTSKSESIDWQKTIINSIGINKVYYTKQELASL